MRKARPPLGALFVQSVGYAYLMHRSCISFALPFHTTCAVDVAPWALGCCKELSGIDLLATATSIAACNAPYTAMCVVLAQVVGNAYSIAAVRAGTTGDEAATLQRVNDVWVELGLRVKDVRVRCLFQYGQEQQASRIQRMYLVREGLGRWPAEDAGLEVSDLRYCAHGKASLMKFALMHGDVCPRWGCGCRICNAHVTWAAIALYAFSSRRLRVMKHFEA